MQFIPALHTHSDNTLLRSGRKLACCTGGWRLARVCCGAHLCGHATCSRASQPSRQEDRPSAGTLVTFVAPVFQTDHVELSLLQLLCEEHWSPLAALFCCHLHAMDKELAFSAPAEQLSEEKTIACMLAGWLAGLLDGWLACWLAGWLACYIVGVAALLLKHHSHSKHSHKHCYIVRARVRVCVHKKLALQDRLQLHCCGTYPILSRS